MTVGSWAGLALAAALAALGILPGAGEVWGRVWPVLAFLLLIKLASDLIDRLGVFDLASLHMARMARGSTRALMGLFFLIATVLTAILSLDATVVLLTPVAITLGRHLRISPTPFLLATVWIANIGSLALPVSNLTNLLAVQHSSWSVSTFLHRLGSTQLALLGLVGLALIVWERRSLSSRFDTDLVRASAHGPSPAISALVGLAITAFGTAVILGAAPWLAALGLDLVLLALRAIAALRLQLAPRAFVHASRSQTVSLLRGAPWTMAAFALALFLLIDPLATIIATHVGPLLDSGGTRSVALMSVLGSVTASATNNLPAYLALEPSATSDQLQAALLVGVNAGPILTPWGSLATLLWMGMARERGEHVDLRQFVTRSIGLVLVIIVTSTIILSH